MGTNYYAIIGEPSTCAHCGHEVEPERPHIGKSSAGWCFSLHVEPNDPEHPQSWEDWQVLLSRPDVVIEDEYGAEHTLAELTKVVTGRAYPFVRDVPPGYRAWAHYHDHNQSEPGPNGLLRHRIGRHCVGHGSGTWDLITGNFS